MQCLRHAVRGLHSRWPCSQPTRSISRPPRNVHDVATDPALPTVVLIGRPNVGKSALYNRLLGRREALVYDTPAGHVTRDYREGLAQLGDLSFLAVDTSGLEPTRPRDTLQARAAQLTAAVLARADVALLLLDATSGVVPADQDLARWLLHVLSPQQRRQQLVVVANKAETRAAQDGMAQTVADCQALGLGAPLVAVSATSGEGLTDLYSELQPRIDAAALRLQQQQQQQQQQQVDPWGNAARREAAPGGCAAGGDGGGAAAAGEAGAGLPGAAAVRVAVMGLPNVGKSSLVNAWLGRERSLTGPEAGLTRDPVAAVLQHEGSQVQVVDTAGWLRHATLAGRRGLPAAAAAAAGATEAAASSGSAYGRLQPGAAAGGAGLRDHEEGEEQRGDGAQLLLPQGLQDAAGVLAPGVRAALLAAAQAQARRSLQAAHVVVLLLDAPRLQRLDQAITKQELSLASLAVSEGKALLVALNKADAVRGGAAAAEKLRAAVEGVLRRRFAAVGELRVASVSAEAGAGTRALLGAAVEARARWGARHSTQRLMRLVEAARLRSLGRGAAGALLERVKWVCQVATGPPGFCVQLRGSARQPVAAADQRFLSNLLRGALGLHGVPLRLHLRYGRGRGQDGRAGRPK